MKKNRIFFLLLIAIVGLSISACSGRGFTPSSWAGLTLQDDSLYAAFNTSIYVLTSNGTESSRITTEEGKSPFYAAPAFTAEGDMIAGSYDNSLYSFDPATGGVNWVYKNSNRFIGSVLVTEEGIFAPNADGNLYALDTSGNLMWIFETGAELWSAPVTDGERLYFTSMDHELYAVNPATGNIIWELDLGGTVTSSPALSEDGVLYVGTFTQEVLAVDSQSGTILWTAETQDWVWASPTIGDGVLYAADLSGILYAFDLETGAPVWVVTGEGSVTGAPLLLEDTIYYVTEAGKFYGVNLEGATRWSRTLEEVPLFGSPFAFGDLLIVRSEGPEPILYAYDLNGEPQWEFTPGE